MEIYSKLIEMKIIVMILSWMLIQIKELNNNDFTFQFNIWKLINFVLLELKILQKNSLYIKKEWEFVLNLKNLAKDEVLVVLIFPVKEILSETKW